MPEEKTKPKALIVEDEDKAAKALKGWLEPSFHVDVSSTVKDGLAKLTELEYDIAFVDMAFGDEQEAGMEIIKFMTDQNMSTRAIVLTGHGTVGNCRDTLKSGVYDYIQKGEAPDYVLRLALEAASPEREITFQLSEENVAAINHLRDVIGTEDMVRVFREGLRLLRWAVDEWRDKRVIASIKNTNRRVYPNLIGERES